jgi:hypothetical protein
MMHNNDNTLQVGDITHAAAPAGAVSECLCFAGAPTKTRASTADFGQCAANSIQRVWSCAQVRYQQHLTHTLSATRCWCLQCTIICSSRTNSAAVHCLGGSTFTATISSLAAAAAPSAFGGFGAAASAAASALSWAPLLLLLLAAVLLLVLVSALLLLLLGIRSLMGQPYTTPNDPAGQTQQHGVPERSDL